MEEKDLNAKNKLVQQLFKTSHNNLHDYLGIVSIAREDKALFAHYIAWNTFSSKITDSKCALPIIALTTFTKQEKEYAENALASLMLLNPRELNKAYQFSKELSGQGTTISGGWRKEFQNNIQKYLTIREASANWWDKASAYDVCIEKAKTDTRVNTFKASKAIEKVDTKTAKKLITIQNEKEKEIKDINANVLILGDCSGSMEKAIEATKKIAGVVSSKVSGDKYLIFFNESPRLYDITNKTSQQIHDVTKNIRAYGMTSVGCGLDYIKDKVLDIIIIISDGGDNTDPLFHNTYRKYIKKMNIEPLVYFFEVKGNATDSLSINCTRSNISIEKFIIDDTFDYYSLPNILSAIKTNRYALLNEILNTPLLTLDKVFNKKGNLVSA